MKVTIEHNGKINVYEDVQLIAGAVVTIEKTTILSVMDDEPTDEADMAKVLLYHAEAAKCLRSLLEEVRYVIAENIVRILSKTEGTEPFRGEAERREE